MKSKKLIPNCLFLILITWITFFSLNHRNTLVQADALNESSLYAADQVIIIFQNNATSDDITYLIEEICPDATLLEQEDHFLLLELNPSYRMQEVIDELLESNLVLIAEPNYVVSTMQVSKDAYARSQWALENTGTYRSYIHGKSEKKSSTKGVDLNISSAWSKFNQETGAINEVIVAIIDTGVDITHEDLASNIWVNTGEVPGDGIDNDRNGYIDDVNGWDFYNNDASLYSYVYDSSSNTYNSDPKDNDDHGTHCAGIIGAVSDNNIGIAGVASNINIKIMPLKIEGGSNGNGTISNAIKAIKYAEKMGAKVCNISWGSSLYSSALEQAIRESSMLFIAAAGNTGNNNDTSPVYPASYDLDNIISVTFINANGQLSSLSNYGASSVDIAAPGYDILSTTVGNSYGVMSGSSMAVPHVSGIAAMIYASGDNYYPSDVKNLILNHITPLSSLENKVIHAGIPNVGSMISSLSTLKKDKKAPTIVFDTYFSGGDLAVSINAKDSGGADIRVIKYLYGRQSVTTFEKGTIGTSITDREVILPKEGYYTFYVSDYAGNERKYIYYVEDDKSMPALTAAYSVSNDYKTITITAFATDIDSGIKQVKYLKGKKTAKNFSSAGSGIELTGTNGVYKFKVSSPGNYTIYAVDYRGNKSVYTLNASIVRATDISVSTPKRAMTPGCTYAIRPVVTPSNSTDQITYKSSNPSVVTVNSNGLITALNKGDAVITLTTSSGKKTTMTIYVV